MVADPAAAQGAVVRVRDLQMSYGSKQVLHGVDLQVHRNEVVALLGPNGAGKTTTIEILEGLRGPSAGSVEVLGVDPIHADEDWRARVGVVLQSWRDHGRWRLRDLLEHFGSFYEPYAGGGRPGPFQVDELLERVGLTEHRDKKVMSLSGGQRRRLDVAVGIVGRPELLFLDEPTVGFDPVARRDFHAMVRQLADLEDTTILLTTHDLAEAEKLADRILILDRGRIVADGTSEELARRVAGEDEVRWRLDGRRHVEHTADSTTYVRRLFAEHGEAVTELEVRRASLEDTYLTMVSRSEAEQAQVPQPEEAAG